MVLLENYRNRKQLQNTLDILKVPKLDNTIILFEDLHGRHEILSARRDCKFLQTFCT